MPLFDGDAVRGPTERKSISAEMHFRPVGRLLGRKCISAEMHFRAVGRRWGGNAFPQSERLARHSECICVSTGSGDAPATRRGRCARRRRRRAGRGRDALMDDGCQRVCCFCGGCRALSALCSRSTQARRAAGGLQHACARSGLCARAQSSCAKLRIATRGACAGPTARAAAVHASARGLSPGAGVGEAHTRLADAVVVDMRGPSRMALPVRVPAAELRAFVQGSCSVWGHVF